MLKSRWVDSKFAAVATRQARRDRHEQLKLVDFEDRISVAATDASLKSLWIMKLGGLSWSKYIQFLAQAPAIR
jgi:hypothetical protein